MTACIAYVLASDTHLANAVELAPVVQQQTGLEAAGIDVRSFFYGGSFETSALDRTFRRHVSIGRNQFPKDGLFSQVADVLKLAVLRRALRVLRRRKLADVVERGIGSLSAIRALVVCNDRFFPEVDLIRIFQARGIPCFLVQESLRKDLQMSESAGPKHGTGGADHIFAWGETSREYFRAVRVPEDRITITGNPRFDRFRTSCAAVDPAASRARWGLPDAPAILLATNPVYAMNMKDAPSAEDCLQTLRTVSETAQALGKVVLWKPHPLEKSFTERIDVQELLTSHSANLRLSWELPLPEAIAISDRVLVFNSTVALEAASMGRPAGLLALTPWNHGVDFVERKIACLLDSPASLSAFLAGENPLPELDQAISRFTPLDGQSAQRIATGIKLAMIPSNP